MRHQRAILGLMVGIFAAVGATTPDQERNLFDWSSVSPMVVAGTSEGENGRIVEFRVIRPLRGDAEPDDLLRIDVRSANRNRDRLVDPKALRLDDGVDYVLLLERVEPSSPKKPPTYRLIRGVDGARELPLEGQEALLSALATLVEIQGSENDRVWWDRFAQLIEETNPTLVATALEQFIKYYRGGPELVPGLVPLLDHPQVGIRQDAARLIGQVVQRNPEDHAIPDAGAVRAELVSRATRDDSALVRVAAIEALAAYPFELVDEVLEQIAQNDPEQKVRYAAELIRMGQRQSGRTH